MNPIVVFDKFLGYQVGGAQRSLHELLQHFSSPPDLLGAQVEKSFAASSYQLSDVSVERFPIIELPRFPYLEYSLNRRRIRRAMQKRNNGLLLTQGLWAGAAINSFQNSSILFVRAESGLNRIYWYGGAMKKLGKTLYLLAQLPFLLQLFHDTKKAMKKADVVIANSQFMKKEIANTFGVEAAVVYPLLDVESLVNVKIPSFSDRPFMTCMGAELIKGRPIIEQLARLMPRRQFMIVGRSFRTVQRKGNITYQPWSNDPTSIYAQAKIVLVPSIAAEGFGRVAVEAMALGIPVIASNRGGLPEVVDKEWLVDDVWDIEAWKKKIEIIENGNGLAESDLKQKAMQFDKKIQIERFREIVEFKLGIVV